jgi:hypothetical protein
MRTQQKDLLLRDAAIIWAFRGTLEEGRWIQRRHAGHSGNPLDAETIRVDIEMMERIRRRASRYRDDRRAGEDIALMSC